MDLGVALVVVVLLAAPVLFTPRGFVDDWVNHLWLTWMQSREISATGRPSLFLNAEPLGVFYPNFAFYGGTLYAIGGYLMAVTGSPVAVFVAIIVTSFAAAYGGTLWVARQAGISGLASHMPAMIVVSGAYYLSDAYGRGSWPEFVASSMIPLVLASAMCIVRRGARPSAILLLGVATTIWSGSHNLTFVWGSIFLAAVAACVLLAGVVRLTRAQMGRLGIVVGVMALGVTINAWFLFPDLSYSLHTQIAQYRAIDQAISGIFSRPSVLFDPLREQATGSTYLRGHYTELPVLVIAWLVAATVALWRGQWSGPVRRLLVLLFCLLGALLILIVDESLWKQLPSALSVIQFTFRLQMYVVMVLAGLTIVLLRVMTSGRDRRWYPLLAGALGLIVLFGVGLGVWQGWNSNAYYFPDSPRYLADRSLVLRYPHVTPPTWYETGQFRDVQDQVVPTDGTVRLLPALVKGESTSQTVSVPPGEGPLASNIAASANLVSVHGLRIAGRTVDGFLALERPSDGRRTVTLTIGRADTTPMQLGPVLSLLGVLGLAMVVLASVIVRRRVRGRRRDSG